MESKLSRIIINAAKKLGKQFLMQDGFVLIKADEAEIKTLKQNGSELTITVKIQMKEIKKVEL